MSCIFLLFFLYRSVVHNANQVLWVSQSLSIQKLVILLVVYIRSLRFLFVVLFNLYCIVSLGSLGYWSALKGICHCFSMENRQLKSAINLDRGILKHSRPKTTGFSSLIAVSPESSAFDLLVVRRRVYYACSWLLFEIWRWYLYISSVLICSFISSLAPGNQLLDWSHRLFWFVIHLVIPQEEVHFRLVTLNFLIVWVLVLNVDVGMFLNTELSAGIGNRSVSGLLPWGFGQSLVFGRTSILIHFSDQVLLHILGKRRPNIVTKTIILRGSSLQALSLFLTFKRISVIICILIL